MKQFGVQVEDGREGQGGEPSVGPVHRNIMAKHDFPSPDFEITTSWDVLRMSVKKYPENRMLDWRKELIDGKLGPYQWKTYKEVYEDVLHVGSALQASGAESGSRIGIYGTNCLQWIVAMQACCAHSLICVPLYDTLGPRAVDFIIEHAEVDFVFVQDKKVKELLKADFKSLRRLRLIVCFTSFQDEERNKISNVGINPYPWNEFLHLGKENPSEIQAPQPFNICTIMYTSGTSGVPKGVILTHENVAMCIRGIDIFLDQFDEKMTVDDVYISFLPLAHILDRMIEEYFFHKGASVGYYSGDINKLTDDMMELKPTFFAGVPRVFERIHAGVKATLQELRPTRRKFFDLLYKYKLAWMNLGFNQKYASPLADLLAFRKIKARLGGRVRLIVSGGAPLSSEIEEFVRVTCCAFVMQGYGLTETCGLASLGHPYEMCFLGTVGAPFIYSEMRLEEVPEMGYDPLWNPPRGEICLKGKTIFSGYHKNPVLTKESIRDGWFHTGDVGEMLPNGILKIIDRRKNLIKLSLGEYVALEYLEKVYNACPIVEDIWVHGDSYKPMLTAVVVPHEANTKRWADLSGHTGSFRDLCRLNELQVHILAELKSIAERNRLRGFENVKGVIVEPSRFELDPDLVTPTLKKRRDRLVKHYQVDIDELYHKLGKSG